MVAPRKVSLEEEFSLFDERWSPKIACELNGQHVKLAKLAGEFVWHSHAEEDEMFLVIEGGLKVEFWDGEASLGEGEMLVVPRGVEHRPVAEREAHVLLFEPASTLNTGDAGGDLTAGAEWI